jgi:hypothetical protein
LKASCSVFEQTIKAVEDIEKQKPTDMKAGRDYKQNPLAWFFDSCGDTTNLIELNIHIDEVVRRLRINCNETVGEMSGLIRKLERNRLSILDALLKKEKATA